MGRVVDARSTRYGVAYNWNGNWRFNKGYVNRVHKDYQVNTYIKSIFRLPQITNLGLIYSHNNVYHCEDSEKVRIYIYDGPFEAYFADISSDSTMTKYFSELGLAQEVKFAMCEHMLIQGLCKLYSKEVEVEFCVLSNKTISSTFLAQYICLKLKQGYNLGELLVGINIILIKFRQSGDLMGYRIDSKGRFTRKQRASYESYRDGQLPLSSINGLIDYGFDEVSLKYGKCSIKVWLSWSKEQPEYSYSRKLI